MVQGTSRIINVKYSALVTEARKTIPDQEAISASVNTREKFLSQST